MTQTEIPRLAPVPHLHCVDGGAAACDGQVQPARRRRSLRRGRCQPSRTVQTCADSMGIAVVTAGRSLCSREQSVCIAGRSVHIGALTVRSTLTGSCGCREPDRRAATCTEDRDLLDVSMVTWEAERVWQLLPLVGNRSGRAGHHEQELGPWSPGGPDPMSGPPSCAGRGRDPVAVTRTGRRRADRKRNAWHGDVSVRSWWSDRR